MGGHDAVTSTHTLGVVCAFVASSAGAAAGEAAPRVRSAGIIYSCDIQGRLLPVACEEGALGGVARRATLFHQWAAEWADRTIVDVGNATIVQHPAADTVNRFTFEALDRLGYAVVNCGDNEAALPVGRLTELARGRKFVTISASLVHTDTGQLLFPAHHVVRRGGHRIAFIGLTGGPREPGRVAQGLRLLDPETALTTAVRALKGEADLIVVLAYLTPERIYDLARKHPTIDVILGGRAQATSAPHEILDRTLIAYLGDGGHSVGRLDASFPQGRLPRASARMALLEQKLPEDRGVAPFVERLTAALGDRKPPGADADPKMPRSTSFVASEVCKLCHVNQFYAWQATPHAGAYVTLLQKEKHKEPTCVRCHATGVDSPRGLDLARADELARREPKTPEAEKRRKAEQRALDALKNVGCESCHGGARRHVGVALRDRAAAKKAPYLRTASAARNCERCHQPQRPCLPKGAADPYDKGKYLKAIRHWRELPPTEF